VLGVLDTWNYFMRKHTYVIAGFIFAEFAVVDILIRHL
jgi:hypothetical protein